MPGISGPSAWFSGACQSLQGAASLYGAALFGMHPPREAWASSSHARKLYAARVRSSAMPQSNRQSSMARHGGHVTQYSWLCHQCQLLQFCCSLQHGDVHHAAMHCLQELQSRPMQCNAACFHGLLMEAAAFAIALVAWQLV